MAYGNLGRYEWVIHMSWWSVSSGPSDKATLIIRDTMSTAQVRLISLRVLGLEAETIILSSDLHLLN